MSVTRDSFIDLEKRRRLLEQNLSELRSLLQHWQTWEAEYEGLKEEIKGLGLATSQERVQAATSDYGGTLLTSDEIAKLVNDDKGNQRDAEQILGLLSRRIDYVQENVKTAQKRYDDAESKLEKINVVMLPENTDEEGLPLTEITEELDDDDNVISHTLQKPGDMAPQILEALQKQGIKDLPSPPSAETIANASPGEHKDSPRAEKLQQSSRPIDVEPNAPEQTEGDGRQRSESPKKKVSFAESTKPPAVDKKPPPKTVHEDIVEQLAQEGLMPDPITDPIIPENETPEQAALRREMLQYNNINDIGRIVAEINLDEQNEDYDYSDASDDDYEVDSEFEEDEDQWGRTKTRVSDQYREEMLALERKLNAKSMINAGPHGADSIAVPESSVDTKAATVTRGESSSDTKKGVRFAPSLDVQEAPASKSSRSPKLEDAKSQARKESPIVDTIVERTAPESKETEAKPRKVSAFRAARAKQTGPANTVEAAKKKSDVIGNGPLAGMPNSRLLSPIERQNRAFASIPPDVYAPSIVPEGPSGKTLADKLVERPMAETASSVREPDELDPALMKQQIATQYHSMRSRMISREGGFTQALGEDEDPEAGAGLPKVSRFKAARLAKVAK